MCRLLGFLDSNDSSAESWLIESERSLLAQSNHAPDELQDDGWGIAWYPVGRSEPTVAKGIRGAFRPEERSRFTAAARSARGPVIIGHLRHASNPLSLPPEALLAIENSQPFQYEGTIFAHNGCIRQPSEVRSRLGRFADRVEGVNDSEVLFWLLLRWDEELGDPVRAYARAVEDLWDVWETSGRNEAGPFSGLNILYARTPDDVWAFCHWRGDHGNGVFATGRPYYEMTYRRVGGGVLIGSEPFDSGGTGWETIPNGTFVHAARSDGHVRVRSGPIPLATEAHAR